MMGKNASCFLRTAFVKTPVFPAIVMVSAVFGCLFQHEQASAEGCPDPSFAAARTFNAGTNPVSVATGDFNGDGKPDLAAANNQGVAVLLDNRDGTFQRAVNYTAGAGPRFVTVGDFNGDGEADLAVANYGEYDQAHYRYTNSSVSVLIGKGDGTFQAAVNYRAGSTPFSLAVGDLNGDGKADLVVANDSANLGAAGSGAGSVLLGNGDGSFQAPFNYGAGTFPVAVAIADFNGDGKLDLAVADGTFGSAYFSLLPGKGNGTFLHPTNYYGARGARSVAAGDFNSDGKPDLAVANDGATNISVFLGKGDGTFQLAVNYATGNGPVSLAVSDFNADGKLDLVSANTGGISVLLGKGDGTFQSALNYFGGGVHYQMPVSLAVGDFNGDGQRDLASANEEGVTVFLGNGAGTFQFAANYDSGMYPVSMAVADFNGDGKPDMAVAQAAYENLTDGSIAVLVGKDNATFETLKTYGAGTRPVSVAVGDFNGDGKLDLAAANTGSYPYYTNGSVSVLLGDGNGTFQTATNFKAGTCPSCVAMGDFNSDGKLDLAVANQGTTRDTTSIGSVSILVGNGDGTFQAAVNYDAGRYPSYAAVGDFNGDGRPDLVVASGNSMIEVGSVFVLLGKSDGTFQLAAVSGASFSVGKNPRSVAVCDFNGDGKPDVAVVNNGSQGLPGDWGPPVIPPDYGSVSVLMSKGDGTFQPAVNYIAGRFPSSVAVGDLNGDGKPDLVVANGNSANVSILVGRGDGTFEQAVNYVAGSGASCVVVSDLNGDGKLDIAVGVDYSHTISLLLNTCASAGIHLGVARSNSALTLSWPLTSTGFALESITSLSSTNWQPAAERVRTNNSRLEIIAPLDQPGRFFRLRKP